MVQVGRKSVWESGKKVGEVGAGRGREWWMFVDAEVVGSRANSSVQTV